VKSVVNQFCLTTNSLRWPRNDAAVSAEGALSTLAFVSWLRRHGTRGSVLSRAAPSAVRRRRNMNCYFHISTVFRMRRETLRVFFAIRAVDGLRKGFPKGFVEQAELSLLRLLWSSRRQVLRIALCLLEKQYGIGAAKGQCNATRPGRIHGRRDLPTVRFGWLGRRRARSTGSRDCPPSARSGRVARE